MNTISKIEFIEIWKQITNDNRIKPTITEIEGYSGKQKIKEKGWLFAEHYILYNIVRGFPAYRGFQENTEGYINALNSLKTFSSRYGVNKLYEPFKEKLTSEKYLQLMEEIKNILN